MWQDLGNSRKANQSWVIEQSQILNSLESAMASIPSPSTSSSVQYDKEDKEGWVYRPLWHSLWCISQKASEKERSHSTRQILVRCISSFLHSNLQLFWWVCSSVERRLWNVKLLEYGSVVRVRRLSLVVLGRLVLLLRKLSEVQFVGYVRYFLLICLSCGLPWLNRWRRFKQRQGLEFCCKSLASHGQYNIGVVWELSFILQFWVSW